MKTACITSSMAMAFLAPFLAAAEQDIFTIQIVDEQTGRGVPLVELRTVNGIRYYSDSAGYVAFREPGLMNQQVFFHVSSHGYEFPQDGFGFRGVRLETQPGREKVIHIKRVNIAERLYRVTGAGIYRDSVLAGKPLPLRKSLLNAQVLGSDSVVNTIYQGKIYWFWGDTNRASYPLGNFHVPGATSLLPDRGGLNPDIGVDLSYFLDESGFAMPTAKLPGKGPTWINGLITLRGTDGHERMFATYVKVEPPLNVYERGLVEFNNVTHQFDKVTEFELQSPVFPGGHPIRHVTGDREYVYFGNPFPVVRVPATPEYLADLSKYEAYSCLQPGSRDDSLAVARRDGSAVFRWQADTIPFTPQLQARLIAAGRLRLEESLFQLHDDREQPVTIHSGSVRWNDFRQRWIMIGVQSFGTSALGEVWYAEAEQLTGPWRRARKIVTHEKYSFYNPKQHAMLDQEGGRFVYFEGTYTNMFSGNDDPTPRYNYNQIMYKLDLADPRLQ